MKYHDKNGNIHNSILGLFSSLTNYKDEPIEKKGVIYCNEAVDESNIIPYDDSIQFVKFESIMINFKDKLITVKYGNKIKSYDIPHSIRLNKIIIEMLYYIDKLV